MKQRAAESKFGIGIELVAMRQQPLRIGSAQSEDEARHIVAESVGTLRDGGIAGTARGTFRSAEVYSVFAWSIDQSNGAPDKTIVETRIRPNGRAKQEKRAA